MADLTWTTHDNGTIEVSGLPGRPEAHVPTLPTGASVRNVLRWLPLVEAACRAHAVPVAWVLAVIYAESGGNDRVVSADHGKGLMQLTHPSLTQGKSVEQCLDPAYNIETGTALIARHMKHTQDLPSLASLYNAGGLASGLPHPDPKSPWGMHETPGHIERVVRANNTFVSLLEAGVCS